MRTRSPTLLPQRALWDGAGRPLIALIAEALGARLPGTKYGIGFPRKRPAFPFRDKTLTGSCTVVRSRSAYYVLANRDDAHTEDNASDVSRERAVGAQEPRPIAALSRAATLMIRDDHLHLHAATRPPPARSPTRASIELKHRPATSDSKPDMLVPIGKTFRRPSPRVNLLTSVIPGRLS